VEKGEVPFCLANNYYWYAFVKESGSATS